MAHVGKNYPRYNESWAWITSPTSLAVRFLPYALKCDFTNVFGTLGNKWDGLTVVSEPAYRDGVQVWYDWLCPTDSASIFRYRFRIEENGLPAPFTVVRWGMDYEFWDAGTKYGDNTFPMNATDVILQPSAWLAISRR